MALIARIQHPYIVEFKEAWVEKVGPGNSSFLTNFFAVKRKKKKMQIKSLKLHLHDYNPKHFLHFFLAYL